MAQYRFIALMASLLAIVFASAVGGYHAGLWRFNNPSLQDYPVRGLDVSHHQGSIRWQEIPRADFTFVYIKATEGGDFSDPAFADNWNQARAAGFRTGAYHFFTLCRNGAAQAAHFIATVSRAADTLPPAIDLEFTGNCSARPDRAAFEQELRVMVDAVENHYGRKPVLYTTYDFHKHYLSGDTWTAYPLWIRAVYGAPASAGPHWTLWQYADNGRVQGIDGPVDLNAARSSAAFD